MLTTADDYLGLLTSQHKGQPKLESSITAAIAPMLAIRDDLAALPSKFDLDTATGDQLQTIGLWVGAPSVVPDGVALALFGFDGQENAQPFGDTTDPDAGGFWRESGLSGYTSGAIEAGRYRDIIRAQIIKNSCLCTLADAYQILSLVTAYPFVIIDTGDMAIFVGLSAGTPTYERQIMRVMFPKPAGVRLRFFENWIGSFGWADQAESLGFGDTTDPDVGGFWILES